MQDEWTLGAKKQEEEIMAILLNSSLFVDMSAGERQKLLSYLVASYFKPRVGENCRAHLKAVRSVPHV